MLGKEEVPSLNEIIADRTLIDRWFNLGYKIYKNYWGEVVLTTTHLINRLLTRVLDYNNLMQLFSKNFPDFKTTNHLVPRSLGVYLLFIFTQISERNLIQGLLHAFFWDIQRKKGISVIML